MKTYKEINRKITSYLMAGGLLLDLVVHLSKPLVLITVTSEGLRYIIGAASALLGLSPANGGAKVRRGGAIYPQYSFNPCLSCFSSILNSTIFIINREKRDQKAWEKREKAVKT